MRKTATWCPWGKIADIYANCGITKKVKATGLDALFDATIKEMKEAGDEIGRAHV